MPAPKPALPAILLARLAIAAALALLFLLVPGCALIRPLPPGVGIEDRLAAFPRDNLNLEKPVRIFWNEHLVPYILAQTDSDLAFCLGLVHAHLRLAQMEIYRRASQGRLAEAFGPYFAKIDHSLRILGLGRAAPELEKHLPEASRLWLERYVEGINAYQERAKEPPHEFRVLGFKPRPWRVADVLTLGRLFGADVNWLSLGGLLKARFGPDWDKVWAAHLEAGESSIPSFEAGQASLIALLAGLSKPGSNSVALGPRKTATGGALLANDPHLGVTLPNLWLIAGYRSPSYNLVGLMVPGLPCVVLGRNPYLGWGGTNMRAASSDLYDISRLDPSRLTETRERVAVRWWFDREVKIRLSPLGPVITDAPFLADYSGPPLALRWVGHGTTDEVSAILAANRARNWDEFLAAWRTYGVSSQNILMADNKGNIGQLLAVALPERTYQTPPDLFLDPADPAHDWGRLLTAPELPHAFNPERGFLVSANNKPVEMSPRVGFSFSSNDRVSRLTQVLEKAEKVDVEFLKRLQRDVVWPSGRELVAAARAALGQEDPADPAAGEVWRAVLAWDGRMKSDSREALAVELLAFHLSGPLLEKRYSDQAAALLPPGLVPGGVPGPGAGPPGAGGGPGAGPLGSGGGRPGAAPTPNLGRHPPSGAEPLLRPDPPDRKPLPVRQPSRGRRPDHPDEDGPSPDRPAPRRLLRLPGPPHLRPVRPGRELFSPPGRPGRGPRQPGPDRHGRSLAQGRVYPPAPDPGKGRGRDETPDRAASRRMRC